MSDPTRYYPAGDGVVRTDPNGPLVNYHYYEELKAENARLKAEVERLGKAIMDSVEMRQRLREIENGNQSK